MEQRIKQVMAAILDVDAAVIGNDSSPKTIGSWDSLRHMNLILGLEDEFGVQFGDDQFAELTSYHRILMALTNLVS
ncbi:MAG: acyl carrier protein [Candidatus Sericytochromatia bacterium]|nr:acyl carrier protein [Candidatus Sericytochromatia bacterium]